MGDDLDRLDSVLDDLASEHDPALRAALSADETRLARAAAFLKAADEARLVPDPQFVETLRGRLAQAQAAQTTPASGARLRPGFSRRGMLGQAAAAIAGLAVGGGVGAAAYEHLQGGTANHTVAADTGPYQAPMVSADRGVWMNTGHDVASLTPGKALRFRAGAVEGFLVNPGAGKAVFALSAACTHMGCMVTWLDNAGTFLCPCHGAQYDANGAVINGIARRPLPRLQLWLGADRRYYVLSVPDHPAITTVAPYSTS